MSKDEAGLGALKSGLAVFSRLFDHRAILQGEARYFIEEFQNKRKGIEGVQLAECQTILDRHCSASLPGAVANADSNLAALDKKVLELTKLCDLIMPDTIEPGDTGNATPVTRPPSPGQDTEWDEFVESMEREKLEVDEHFRREVEQYRIYLELHGPPVRDETVFGRKGYSAI